MPLINPCLSKVEESTRNGERGDKEPQRRKQPTRHRLERPIPVADRGDRHHREVEGIEPSETLDEAEHAGAKADAEKDDTEGKGDLHPNPHPPLLDVDDVVPGDFVPVVVVVLLLLLLVLLLVVDLLRLGDGGEEEGLLKVEHVGHHSGEEDINESEADDDEGNGEDFGGGGGGGDVAVANGAHGNDAEVESVDDWVSLSGGEVVSVKSVDGHTEGEVDDEEEEGLGDDGGPAGRVDPGGADLVDGGHGRRGAGAMEIGLPSRGRGVAQPRIGGGGGERIGAGAAGDRDGVGGCGRGRGR